jgi:hypothetical protein
MDTPCIVSATVKKRFGFHDGNDATSTSAYIRASGVKNAEAMELNMNAM